MKKLKFKIFASFMLLIALLAVAGTLSIVEFIKLSNSVHGIIDDNYKSIEASKTMLEALEREDSGILLMLLGAGQEAVDITKSADSAFMAAFQIAKNNITEENEEELISLIKTSYSEFVSGWNKPIVTYDNTDQLSLYKNSIHKNFLTVKTHVNKLMHVNQTSMYKRASDLKEKSKRAIMPGIVAIISAVIFSAVLNFFISRYFVKPLTDLANAIDNYKDGNLDLNVNLTSNDEIKKLEQSVANLLRRISKQ
jgi:methyl-accepting chemotaxis protein